MPLTAHRENRMDTREISYQDLAGDLGTMPWLVNLQTEDGEIRRIKIQAVSEQAACIECEDRFGGNAISARLSAR
jgi:hypothetical protein